ncbi:hypothetical protein ACNKHP_02515 [Shigella boydii]
MIKFLAGLILFYWSRRRLRLSVFAIAPVFRAKQASLIGYGLVGGGWMDGDHRTQTVVHHTNA